MFQNIRAFSAGPPVRRMAATGLGIALPLTVLCLFGFGPRPPVLETGAKVGDAPEPQPQPAMVASDPAGSPDALPGSAAGAEDQADAALSEAMDVDPSWIDTVPAGDMCGTHQHYLAELAAQGISFPEAVCPTLGPCDDPATRNAAIPDSNTPIKTYFLSIHVFCDKKGNNCTTSQATVNAAMAALNTNYAPYRIQFINEVDFIKDAKYLVLDPGEESQMKRRYSKSPSTKLNIFVSETGNLSWGTFPWSSWALTYSGGIVVDRHYFGVGRYDALTHEVGHCLGLWHTFHGVSEVTECSDCYEYAGRPPEVGDVTGDFCSETTPTPRNNYCVDPGTTDPCTGLLWTDTPVTNHMSYGFCGDHFEAQQAGRMHCWTAAVSGWLR
jgi:hypothetical protein